MRITNSLLLVLVLFGFMCLFAQPIKASLIVQPKKDNVGVYMNVEKNEATIFNVNADDRICVTEETKEWYHIWINNKTGWILKSDVIILQKSKRFEFADAEVMGYLDNPTPIYIIDANNKDQYPINLDRSFKEDLRENTDREIFERSSSNQ